MFLLEMAAAKCIDSAGTALGQLSGALSESPTIKTVKLYHPSPPSLHDPFGAAVSDAFVRGAHVWQDLFQDLPGSLSFTAGSAVAVVKDFAPAVSVSVGVYCALRHFGVLSTDDDDDAGTDSNGNETSGLLRWVPRSMKVLGVIDVVFAGVVVHSIGDPSLVPLQRYAIGGLILGFPVSYLIDKVVKKHGIRAGFVLETLFTAVSFAWLACGTCFLSSYPDLLSLSPSLWWAVFIQHGFSWATMTTMIIGLALLTVASLMLRNSKPQ